VNLDAAPRVEGTRMKSRSRRHRSLLLAALVLGGLLLARTFWPVSAATRAGWVADLDRLEAHTAAAYANLGDRLTPQARRARSTRRRAALADARTLGAARAALIAFVEAFDDPHFGRRPYSAPPLAAAG
jgi:hypothetical protein